MEYTDLKSMSVYIAMPVPEEDMTPRLKEAFLKGRQRCADADLAIAIWTTTPWTLPANMVRLIVFLTYTREFPSTTISPMPWH